MSAQLLTNELTNLISEAKRKNADLRNVSLRRGRSDGPRLTVFREAAEKALQELKSLPATSEQQLASDLSRRPTFIEPFLLACGTRNAKYAISGTSCLQRLVISRALPKARLQDVLEAFNACTGLNLEIQLKVLQALPALLQNYADELKGDLLSGALQVCSTLQRVKSPAVSGVAAATLQQLLTSVFDKVTEEDRRPSEATPLHEVTATEGPIKVRSAAYDAYRIFLDLILATEGRKGAFVDLSAVGQASGLELIASCLDTHYKVFASHEELTNVLRAHLFAFLLRSLSERQSFGLTVRSMRIVDLLLKRHQDRCPHECEMALHLLTQMLEPDSISPWKRAMVMEVFRGLYGDSGYLLKAFSRYDSQECRKNIVQDNIAAFVRVSTERPAVIGLGQQSTIPTGPPQRDTGAEQVALEAAGGVAGVIITALGVVEVSIPGISSQWSGMRTQCIDQLDKTDPPSVPDTYIYSLVLDCLNSLSEILAKVVLPLTVQHETGKLRQAKVPLPDDNYTQGAQDSASTLHDPTRSTRPARSQSFRTRAVPTNPLALEDSPAVVKVRTCAALIEACWPALLATCSTFLYAALDNEYYRTLIKSYQRFAQVAGLLRLSTPRDAFMTTLGKAAVPPQVLNTNFSSKLDSPGATSPRIFSSSRSMLSVDSFVSQASGLSSDKGNRASYESSKPTLTPRNLLCLRALLNLAIALGPTLEASFSVVVETLKQADMVLSATGPSQILQDARQGGGGTPRLGTGSPSVVQAVSTEVAAVEAAASRLLESTADYPNDAFVHVLKTFCGLLHGRQIDGSNSLILTKVSPPSTPQSHMRSLSSIQGISTNALTQAQDFKFVLPKIGNLVDLNVARFASNEPEVSGWSLIVNELTELCADGSSFNEARRMAVEILGRMAVGIITNLDGEDLEYQHNVQQRTLTMLLEVIRRLYSQTGGLTVTDVDVHANVLQTLRGIFEECGESLSAGWDDSMAIANSVFEDEQNITMSTEQVHSKSQDRSLEPSQWVSIRLGRASFAIVQLICSDFLNIVPKSCFSRLIELLYRFMSQNEDLNVSLTTITMVWNLSDFLFSDKLVKEVDVIIEQEGSSLSDERILSLSAGVPAAQWLLVLVRLRNMVADERVEVRNAGLQIICSIFRNHGEKLMPATWDLSLRSIILRIPANDVRRRLRLANSVVSLEELEALDSTSTMILDNTASLLASYLPVLEHLQDLPEIWDSFVSILESYLSLSRLVISAAVYSALALILSNIKQNSQTRRSAVGRAASMWARSLPATGLANDSGESNQLAFEAYTNTASQIYRLTREDVSVAHIESLTRNLVYCIRKSDRRVYSSDVGRMTTLQSKTMDIFIGISTDILGVVPVLIKVAAELVSLPFEDESSARTDIRPTFVALAIGSMAWLETLIQNRASDDAMFESGAISAAIESLGVPVKIKYTWKGTEESLVPWRRATSTIVSVLDRVLKRMDKAQLISTSAESLWVSIVDVANAIVAADCTFASHDADLVGDEDFDMASVESMSRLLIPRLGDESLPDELRQSYCRSLFQASIIHAHEGSETPDDPLETLLVIRRGRVRDPPSSQREALAYRCLNSLLALTSVSDRSSKRRRLAKAAAPWLVLRVALPIKAYIADQPLRGRMPQPLSEQEELLYCLKEARSLRCETGAFAGTEETKGRSGDNVHLQLLYPLLVRALEVAGDRRCGDEKVLTALEQSLDVAGRSLW